MGGKAFDGDQIVTPRMPTSIYEKVLRKVEETLSTLFNEVAHAIEGPEKTTHGDLDVLFVAPANMEIPSVEAIARLLGAVEWTAWQKNGIAQFAIPWPNEDGITDMIETTPQSTSKTIINDNDSGRGNSIALRSNNIIQKVRKCIQVDLNRFPNSESMRWQLFNTSHGDLCNILSNIVRSKGLTISTEALWLRIASVEKHNRKAGRIELSRDPEQVLQFFGLDPVRFWQPFDTLDEMMRYATTSRFFQPVRQRVNNDEASLYWTDQKYLYVRPIFIYWIDTFLPAHKLDTPGKDAHLTREQTLDDVFNFFGSKTKEAYETQKRKADMEIARQFLWPNVRSAIRGQEPGTSDKDMDDTIKAIKRVSQYNLRSSHTDGSYSEIRKAYIAEDYDAVIAWSAEYHEQALNAFRAGNLEDIVGLPPGSHHPSGFIRPTETYTEDDDKIIRKMKIEGATWPEIMKALGKESKSQLQAHWKMNLQGTASE